MRCIDFQYTDAPIIFDLKVLFKKKKWFEIMLNVDNQIWECNKNIYYAKVMVKILNKEL